VSHAQGCLQYGIEFAITFGQNTHEPDLQEVVVNSSQMEVRDGVQIESNFDVAPIRIFGRQFNGKGARPKFTFKPNNLFSVDIDFQIDSFNAGGSGFFGQNANFSNRGERRGKMGSDFGFLDFPVEIYFLDGSNGQCGLAFFIQDFIMSLGREVGDLSDWQIQGNGKVTSGLLQVAHQFEFVVVVGISDQRDGGVFNVGGVQLTLNLDGLQGGEENVILQISLHGAFARGGANEFTRELDLFLVQDVCGGDGLSRKIGLSLEILFVFGESQFGFNVHVNSVMSHQGIGLPNFGVFGEADLDLFQRTAHLTFGQDGIVVLAPFWSYVDTGFFAIKDRFCVQGEQIFNGKFGFNGSIGFFQKSRKLNGSFEAWNILFEEGHIQDAGDANVSPGLDFHLGSGIKYHILSGRQCQHFFEVSQISVAWIESFQFVWDTCIDHNGEFSSLSQFIERKGQFQRFHAGKFDGSGCFDSFASKLFEGNGGIHFSKESIQVSIQIDLFDAVIVQGDDSISFERQCFLIKSSGSQCFDAIVFNVNID